MKTTFDQNEFLGNYYKSIHIPTFAREIILWGQAKAVDVCNAYGVTDEDFVNIIELPSFKKEMRELRALIEASPNAIIQLKARAVVEEGIDSLAEIAFHGAKDNDRINAMKLLSSIAGISTGGVGGDSDNGKPQASGLVLNVNLGKHGGLIPALPDVQRPLRTVKQIQEVIDVKPS